MENQAKCNCLEVHKRMREAFAENESLRNQLAEKDKQIAHAIECHDEMEEVAFRLAEDALSELSPYRTPEEGYIDAPQCLKSDIRNALTSAQEEGFNAARKTVETCIQEGGYSYNHHRHDKWRTFADWKASKGKENGKA